MKKAFETIFKSLLDDLKQNLEADKRGTLADSSKPLSLKGSGSIPFNFHLDDNGKYHFETEKYGAGKTVHACALIDDPDATYTITVSSSDGGGGHWENVHCHQELCFNINTSFWHSTKITVDIKANVMNRDGHGKINYN